MCSNGCATHNRSGELPGKEALKKHGELVSARWEFPSSIANLMKLHIYNRIDRNIARKKHPVKLDRNEIQFGDYLFEFPTAEQAK